MRLNRRSDATYTVKSHVHNAFAKLGINSRAQLAQLMQGSD
jgi:DNA-binding CsgD family transcriptional regulator